MERRIVVAVDESEESKYALSWCLKNLISESSKDTIILLNVRPSPPVYPALDGTGYIFSSDIMATMDKYSKDLAEAVLEKAKMICQSSSRVTVETKLGCGDAREVICEQVEKLGGDLLVMGSHGYGAFKRAFLGSVSNHCANNTKCPVLIVKRPKA
ncbi:universal stress protein A-like protein [Amborella trichopoda]|uniref:UspA domain-containing protein n=1 Tax=Amborella trichopoda TaxID=13333 RepID=W1P7X6_AMBTC|nr:universal stress protein A-like protein [Amborella trichopoda]ERN03090.1 hypothetical protein AMTR_s00003p00027540 [Amborella trichopoda]|eukprot:XP_006841415.1 universal stress protein A-like protein [Amborella trichopoda]